jgi:integrase
MVESERKGWTFSLLFLLSGMASLWKHPNSKFWTACFTDEAGRRVKKSTKLTNRKDAMTAALAFEEAATKARSAELTRAQAMKILNEMMERVHSEGIDKRSTRQVFEDHLDSLRIQPSTLKRYRSIVNGFLAHIGEARAGARLASITPQEVESYRNAEIKSGKVASTAAFAMDVLKSIFEDARRKAVILHNPVHAIKPLTDTTAEEREPFTTDQVKTLLHAADNEWRGMVLLGFHTGIRIGDAANLTFANIEGNVLRFSEKKTSHRKKRASERITTVVLPADVISYLETLPTPINRSLPLFSTLHGKDTSELSDLFVELMQKAKIDRKPGAKKKGLGRQFYALSFHSLRHTMISRLANSDAPDAVSKAMSGHSTDAAHQRYIHLDLSAQEKVVAAAPRLWQSA